MSSKTHFNFRFYTGDNGLDFKRGRHTVDVGELLTDVPKIITSGDTAVFQLASDDDGISKGVVCYWTEYTNSYGGYGIVYIKWELNFKQPRAHYLVDFLYTKDKKNYSRDTDFFIKIDNYMLREDPYIGFNLVENEVLDNSLGSSGPFLVGESNNDVVFMEKLNTNEVNADLFKE